jgi:hypothetical protein
MSEYLTMLDVACSSYQSSFYERCQQHGLNIDILLRWIKANGIKFALLLGPTSKDAPAAKSIARSFTPSKNSATNIPVALKVA